MVKTNKINKLETLKDFSRIASDIESKNIPESYWESEDVLLRKREEEKENVEQAISMTSEKFHKCFSL